MVGIVGIAHEDEVDNRLDESSGLAPLSIQLLVSLSPARILPAERQDQHACSIYCT